MDAPTGLPSYAHTVRNIISATTEFLAAADKDGDHEALNSLMAEVMAEDPEDLVVAYTGILATFIEALAAATGVQPADAWRTYATNVAASLAAEEAA